MGKLRIALAQINTTVGDITANRNKIIDYIGKAANRKADIVLLPELSTTGYPPEDLILNSSFVDDNLASLNKIAEVVGDIVAAVGFVDVHDGKVYNAAAIIHDGKIIDKYRKIHLPNYSVFDEMRYFKQGNATPVYSIGKNIFGVNICEDIWHPCGPIVEQRRTGARIAFNISASPYHAGKSISRKKLVINRATENNVCVAMVNLVGGQDELVFDGNSVVVDNTGKVLAEGSSFEEELILVDVDIEDAAEVEIDNEVTNVGGGFSAEKPPLPPRTPHICAGIEEIYHALVTGTKDYVQKNGFNKVVLGLSGGIDSSVTAAIAVAALGNDGVVGVTMPSVYSSTETKTDAEILAKNLGTKLITIPIQDIFKVYLQHLEPQFEGQKADVTEENLQARVRGNLLMALSNKFNWLVLTTGNKSELSMGYSTLYGDMAGGFAVIKDVPKTVVYKLAEFINEKAGKEVIPVSVLQRAPSAELRFDQKDSDSLPPYDLLDKVIQMYVEEDKSFAEMIEAGIEPELIKRVVTTIDRNEYKRRQSPPGIKITPRAFGKDRRFPITNRYTYPEG